MAFAIGATVAQANVTVNESGNLINVSNGLTSFTVNRSNGRMTSLMLGSQPLISESATRGYFSANVGDIGVGGSTYWEMGFSGTTASYNVGPDFVDIALHFPATASMPMDVTQHYVLREGETGFHVYANVHHTTAMPDKRIEEMRFVLRGNPSLFTHHWVTEDRQSIMPTPADLVNRQAVIQDATDLLQPGTAYEAETGRRIYTKYDWAASMDEVDVWGFYGATHGAWIVQPNRESYIGGPMKQELTVHQTNSTPVLLNMLVGQHYSTPGSVETVGNYDRALGPFYVHLNSGESGDAMAADARTYFDPNYHRSFYDSLGATGWVDSADRGQVNGLLQFADGNLATGATVVLADNQTDFQFSKQGYQYETTVNADGTFNMQHVRPGTYRLSAYLPGTYGELQIDHVTVTSGGNLHLGTLEWTVPNNGTTLWQIGTFDRRGSEFRNGDPEDYRRYGLWERYSDEFPNDVNFVIGESDEATDWNAVHWQRVPEGHSPQWNVHFDVGDLPKDKTMTLTIAVAGQQNSRLRAAINGTIVENDWNLPHSGSVLHRSGIQGAYQSREITFSSNLLASGQNTLTLSHVNPGSQFTRGIIYDALRLEINAPLGDIEPPPPTTSKTISTIFGRGADAEVSENTNNGVTTSGGNGTGAAMNARWIGPDGDRNEYILLRFDLSQLDPDTIETAALELTAFRNMSDFNHRVYGLNHDAAGQLWDEGTIDFATAPALEFDGNSGTRGLIQDAVTLLGEFSTGGFNEGDTISFQSQSLADFLNQMAGEDYDGEGAIATLIVERVTENSGQSRFATKEATHLESTTPGIVAAGTYAPQLVLSLLDPYQPGDFNGDGTVDGHDFLYWQRAFAAGDMTAAELAEWEAHFGNGEPASAATVPEPASMIIAFAILLMLPRV